MLRNGLKPVFVFDGKPPDMKSGELEKRRAAKLEAEKKLKEAEETGDTEAMEKFGRRNVKMTKKHIAECKRLLTLMGIPIVEAPSEAEGQCAELVKKGKAWATATEDMDALTFGTTVQLRRLTFPESRKMPVLELNLAKVLEGLNMTMAQFIDFCILCGCDYCDTIRGIGPKTALAGIRKYKTMEKFVESLKGGKKEPPASFLEVAVRARSMFHSPEVTDASTLNLKWKSADVEAVKKFLVDEKGFQENRVDSAMISLAKAMKATQQKRIDSFFSFGAPKSAPKKAKTEATTTAKMTKKDEVKTATTTTTTSPDPKENSSGENKRKADACSFVKKPSFCLKKRKTPKKKKKKSSSTSSRGSKPSFCKR